MVALLESDCKGTVKVEEETRKEDFGSVGGKDC